MRQSQFQKYKQRVFVIVRFLSSQSIGLQWRQVSIDSPCIALRKKQWSNINTGIQLTAMMSIITFASAFPHYNLLYYTILLLETYHFANINKKRVEVVYHPTANQRRTHISHEFESEGPSIRPKIAKASKILLYCRCAQACSIGNVSNRLYPDCFSLAFVKAFSMFYWHSSKRSRQISWKTELRLLHDRRSPRTANATVVFRLQTDQLWSVCWTCYDQSHHISLEFVFIRLQRTSRVIAL